MKTALMFCDVGAVFFFAFLCYLFFMKVIRSDVMGFCFGVRRAVELAEKALAENPDSNVYALGALIHNESVLEELKNKGLKTVNSSDLDLIPPGSLVIIRAHGVPPLVVNNLLEKNCKIIDATCPRVKASQKMVERFSSGDDYVVLAGDKNHGEVVAIAGYAGKNFERVQNVGEAQKFLKKCQGGEGRNVILLAQTTFSPGEFQKISELFKANFKNLDVMNTICPATNERQSALLALCSKVQGVLVIGGKESANTKRLFETASRHCPHAAYIQTAEDIPQDFFDLDVVGITAGASTPDKIIDQVEKTLTGFWIRKCEK